MTVLPKIAADLTPGEQVLWHQSPNPVALFFAKTGFVGMLIGGAVGSVFCWIGFTAPEGNGWFLSMIGLFVVGSLVYEFASGFWTEYAITNRRLLILHPSMFATVLESYYPPDIDFLKKIRRKSGNGSIVFSAVREKSGKRTQTVEIGFFGIRDVDQVESHILALRTPTGR